MASKTTCPEEIQKLLPDFPKGPLTAYRNKASFDWRKLSLAFDDEELIRFKNNLWGIFKSEKLFEKSLRTLPVPEQQKLAFKRMILLRSKNTHNFDQIAANPKLHAAWVEAVFTYDVAMGVMFSITYKMVSSSLRGLGTERHSEFLRATESSEIICCFALTEIAHGSNVKGMRTTATYDAKRKEYVLHSENLEAAKCWVGLLGKFSTHGIIFANLITPDGKDQGLHGFIVPIRCRRTLLPFPGIVVGDIGEKVGLNGVDNGFIMFYSYRIPAENLLNRLGDVDDEGCYHSPIEDPNKRFAISLGTLSGGRVQITKLSTNHLQKSVTIALRYSAVRKQFGPDDTDYEFPVLEYQQQQYRLLPYLAATYAFRVFSNWFMEMHTITVTKEPSEGDFQKAIEIHGLSSAAKPVITWIGRDGIQVCREACGGHGYLKASGFGDMRGDNDANCTYEGENNVLLQQTGNWLLNIWQKIQNGRVMTTPYNSVSFLNDYKNIIQFKSTGNVTDATDLLSAYKWLIVNSLITTTEKMTQLSKSGKDNFTVKNESQVFYSATLSVLYAEHCILDTFHDFVKKIMDIPVRNIMMLLVRLYGAWSLEKHLGRLYMGGFYKGNAAKLLHEGLLDLCTLVTPDAIALVDAFGLPDFILNSVLGHSDGCVYEHLQTAIFSQPDALTRPDWWHEIVDLKAKLPSKI